MKNSTLWLIVGGFITLALLGGGLAVGNLTNQGLIQQFAEAIATAEGFFVNGSRPQRNNNPGDLTVNGRIAVYPTIEAGWAALYKQVSEMFYGGSHYYNPSMTILQVGQVYAPDSPQNPNQAENWANNVAAALGVTTDTTLQQLMGG